MSHERAGVHLAHDPINGMVGMEERYACVRVLSE